MAREKTLPVATGRLYVGVTDWNWFDFLRRRSDLDEVNFWRPRGGQLTAEPGMPFLFKLKAPRNAIGGFGYFDYAQAMTLAEVWEFYGEANGTNSLGSLRSAIQRLRGGGIAETDRLSCIVLRRPTFFAEEDWIRLPDDWSQHTQTGKYYDLHTTTGASLWNAIVRRILPQPMQTSASLFGGEAAATLVVPRLGQGTFRKIVLAAYDNRCAITGERTVPVLQASHIKPFADVKGHEIQNGISLRSDIHTLFDRGYVTVTKAGVFRVSARLRDDFSNGRAYYQHDGQPIRLPNNETKRPKPEYLEWHADEIFKG